MIYLKKKNRWLIHQFAIMGMTQKIQGSKLEALHRLIQIKGEPIEAEGDLNGIMALEFAEGQYVAMRHKPVKKENFYPWKLTTNHIETINPN